jgi:hypothetical protein
MNRRDRPRICLFAGPSLPAPDIRAAFATTPVDVQVLPPVRQGDILRLLDERPDVIGIIDGYFFHTPSVLHGEILLALERATWVLGASSMGALRAAELDVFGMEGVGTIYDLYRRGALDGDDEVAVVHAGPDEGFRPLTEALVNIRHNLRCARRRGILSAETTANALSYAKRLPFVQRMYPAILGTASGAERSAFDRFLREDAVDLKREDALRLVREIVAGINGLRPWPPTAPPGIRQTSLLDRYRREYAGQWIGGQHVPDRLTLAFEQLLSPAFPALHRRISRRCLALDEAAHRGLRSDASMALLAMFRGSQHLSSDSAFHDWLSRRRMTPAELVQLLLERDVERRILDVYRIRHSTVRRQAVLMRQLTGDVAARHGIDQDVLTRPLLRYPGVPWTGPLMRELKCRGIFVRALNRAHGILQHNALVFGRHPQFARASIRRGLLDEFFARRWGIAPEHLDIGLRQRGFIGDDDFVEPARHVYVYERTVRASSTAAWGCLSDCFVRPD